MSDSIKLKLILAGSPNVIKTPLIKNETEEMAKFDRHFNLGVSIETVNVVIDEKKSCSCSLWELKEDLHLNNVYSKYIRGGRGCLLFFDLSIRETFEELEPWIAFIRDISKKIPVILIGIKNNSKSQVTPKEIDDFLKSHGILGYYSASTQDEIRKKEVLKNLVSHAMDYHLTNSIE